MALRDYVVQTGPSQEALAFKNLTSQKFDVYYPTIVVERMWRWKLHQVEEPLFHTYIFVRFDIERDRWRSINGTRGVKGLMSLDPNPEKPTPMPEGGLDAIRERYRLGEFRPPPPPDPIVVGELVRLKDGPFAGYEGFCKESTERRIEVLLSIFGRKTKVSLPPKAVERVVL